MPPADNLYWNAALASVWGNTIGTNTVPGTGSGLAQNITVYRLIRPARTSRQAPTRARSPLP